MVEPRVPLGEEAGAAESGGAAGAPRMVEPRVPLGEEAGAAESGGAAGAPRIVEPRVPLEAADRFAGESADTAGLPMGLGWGVFLGSGLSAAAGPPMIVDPRVPGAALRDPFLGVARGELVRVESRPFLGGSLRLGSLDGNGLFGAVARRVASAACGCKQRDAMHCSCSFEQDGCSRSGLSRGRAFAVRERSLWDSGVHSG